MASSTNFETYAAAQVFYWVGFNGLAYILDVFIADTSSLQWRALLFAFTTSPYIATTFAGPAAAQSFANGIGWRWGFGIYTIVTPIISAPFLLIFWYNQRVAKAQGVIVESHRASGRRWTQSVVYYLIEFDCKYTAKDVGWLSSNVEKLLGSSSFAQDSPCSCYHSIWHRARHKAGAAHTLSQCWCSDSVRLPLFWSGNAFSLPSSSSHSTTSRIGPVSTLYLQSVKRITDFAFSVVIGACLLPMTTWISFYLWDSYFLPYLRVVHDLSIADAGYVANM